tara:strand:+ start:507 stop:1031 length:525 start_codon:yes stop_codon:yes gene_type:complete
MSENREEIIAKINKYIDWLATPNEVFGGFPICPFVEKERASGKLKYEIFRIGFTKSIFNLIDEWDDEYEYSSMIIAHISDIQLDEYKKFQHWINRGLRKRNMGYVKCIAFHPDDTFEVSGVNTRNQAPYFLLNIAYADELNKTHKHLLRTKYFDNFTEENKKYLKVETPKSGTT